jgi:hypothetical protein
VADDENGARCAPEELLGGRVALGGQSEQGVGWVNSSATTGASAVRPSLRTVVAACSADRWARS